VLGRGVLIFHSTWDNVSSTINLRQAGFPDCIDSEQMFIELFDALGVRILIPRVWQDNDASVCIAADVFIREPNPVVTGG
jgi:hypothetical protein